MQKLLKNRTGGVGLIGAVLVFLLVNVLMLMAIRAFSLDPAMSDELVGQGYTNLNESLREGETSYTNVGWLTSFRVTFSNIPWWLTMILVTFEGVMVAMLIALFIRGVN